MNLIIDPCKAEGKNTISEAGKKYKQLQCVVLTTAHTFDFKGL